MTAQELQEQLWGILCPDAGPTDAVAILKEVRCLQRKVKLAGILEAETILREVFEASGLGDAIYLPQGSFSRSRAMAPYLAEKLARRDMVSK